MGYGDDLMLVGEARQLRRRDPRKVAPRRGAHIRRSPVFDNNPHLATDGEIASGAVQWLDENAGRRYRLSETPERRVWTNIGPTRGDLFFTPAELEFADAAGFFNAIVVEPTIKLRAPVNKDWGFERWQALVDLAPRLPWLQLGEGGTRRLRGVRFIETPSFRHAAAVMTTAAAAVLPDGGLHHAAAAINLPAVVIFTGYISPRQVGYASHVNIWEGGEPCGWRLPCEHCRQAAARIAPARVLEELVALVNREAQGRRREG